MEAHLDWQNLSYNEWVVNPILIAAVYMLPSFHTELVVDVEPPAKATSASYVPADSPARVRESLRRRSALALLQRMMTENFTETANSYPDAKVEGFAVNLMAFAGLLDGKDKAALYDAASVFRDQAFSQEEARKAWVDVAGILERSSR